MLMYDNDFDGDFCAVMTYFYPGKLSDPKVHMQVMWPLRMTDEFLDETVGVLEFSRRAINAVQRQHVNTMRDFVESFTTLNKFRNCGAGTVMEMRNKFIRYYYNTLSPEKKKQFWNDFMKENPTWNVNKKKK